VIGFDFLAHFILPSERSAARGVAGERWNVSRVLGYGVQSSHRQGDRENYFIVVPSIAFAAACRDVIRKTNFHGDVTRAVAGQQMMPENVASIVSINKCCLRT
jgi:hypothetical protein